MGCCASKADVAQPSGSVNGNKESLLPSQTNPHPLAAGSVAEQEVEKTSSNPSQRQEPSRAQSNPLNAKVGTPFGSSPIPFNSSPIESIPPFSADAAHMAKSPSDTNSVMSWEGGDGVWRVCDGDVTPTNALTAIMEERIVDCNDNDINERPCNSSVEASPFFRSVSSAETTPVDRTQIPTNGRAPMSVNNHVLSSIMQEHTEQSVNSNVTRNPLVKADTMSPAIEGSPFFRSVSSAEGTPALANATKQLSTSKDKCEAHSPFSMGSDMGECGIWREVEGEDAENVPPAKAV